MKAVLQSNIQTASGTITVASGASVEIRDANTGSLVTLYSTRAGAAGPANPLTADANGFFRVYVDPGRYDITATKDASVQTFEDVVTLDDEGVSRKVMTTAMGGVGSEDGANTWAMLGSFSLASANDNATFIFYILSDFESTNSASRVIVNLRTSSGSYSTSVSTVHVYDIKSGSSISHNSLKLTADSLTAGTEVKLWMKKSKTFCRFSIVELSSNVVTAWNDGSAWQSATPTGAALNITSDWDGSGQLTSTTFLNGWSGTDYYEKDASGNYSGRLDITTPGTTTNGTIIRTIPAGYRHNDTVPHIVDLHADGVTGGVAGKLHIDSSGNVAIYDYVGGGTNYQSENITYRVRG